MATLGKASGPSGLALMSWNVRGLNNGRKRKQVVHYLQRHAVDIACLQETHIPKSDPGRSPGSWGQHRFFSNFSSYARGTAILIHKRVPFQLHREIQDENGRYTILIGRLVDHVVAIANVYAPNVDCPEFFQKLHAQLTDLHILHLLVGGDLNLLVDTALDCSKKVPQPKPRSLIALQELCNAIPLTDRWRQLNLTLQIFMHYSGQHNTYTRIDYWYMSPEVGVWYKELITLPRTYSDHSPLLLHLQIPRLEGFERQWRFPGRALADELFHNEVCEAIELYFETNTGSVSTWATLWEAFKACINAFAYPSIQAY